MQCSAAGREQNKPLWSEEAPPGGLSTCSRRIRHGGSWHGRGYPGWQRSKSKGLGVEPAGQCREGNGNDRSFLASA